MSLRPGLHPGPLLSLIAAVARDRVIGIDNRLPWHLPEDLRHFRATTRGHAVIMGRKTWESLPENVRPLPGRQNIVLSRQAGYAASGLSPGVWLLPSLPAALEKLAAEQPDATEAFIIGGERLYAEALPLAHRLLLTEIDLQTEGDAWFPAFNREEWREASRENHVSEQGIPFAFVRYERLQAAA
ncbi:MAG: dihydrofolate reductase [Zoogloeaceae bacterium]|jgi:dihydrofolate reductase|nr:dihydrofolate reductase [Zoogloeaceae bacterium]